MRRGRDGEKRLAQISRKKFVSLWPLHHPGLFRTNEGEYCTGKRRKNEKTPRGSSIS